METLSIQVIFLTKFFAYIAVISVFVAIAGAVFFGVEAKKKKKQ